MDTVIMGLACHRTEIHYFTCPTCKKQIPLPRKQSKRRTNGHQKNIYCPFCKEVKTFTEKY